MTRKEFEGENKYASKYFSFSSGGNNRNWSKRYYAMVEKYKMLKSMEDVDNSKRLKNIIKGYELCLDTFHEKV